MSALEGLDEGELSQEDDRMIPEVHLCGNRSWVECGAWRSCAGDPGVTRALGQRGAGADSRGGHQRV